MAVQLRKLSKDKTSRTMANTSSSSNPLESIDRDSKADNVFQLTREETEVLVNLLQFQYIPYDNLPALMLLRKMREWLE